MAKRQRKVALGAPASTAERRTSVRLPYQMLDDLKAVLQEQGVGSRGRSQWVAEAVGAFLAHDDLEDMLAEEFILRGTCSSMPLLLPQATIDAIDVRVEQASRNLSASRDRSALIRAAISKRVMEHRGWKL